MSPHDAPAVSKVSTPDTLEISEHQRQAIFDRRAEALAAPPAPPRAADAFEALTFALGRERYAFPSNQVSEVRPIEHITALPSAPSFVAGLVNVRGSIISVLDLRPVFGAPSEAEPPSTAILVSVAEGDVAILTTSEPSLVWLRADELSDLPQDAPAGLAPRYVRGITPDLVVVLDAAKLLADERLLVREEP